MSRLAIQIWLYRQGFVSVSADEFARGLRAVTWSQQTGLNFLADLNSPWPPFEMYLHGMLIRLGGAPFFAPRATAFIFSCILLYALFLLVDQLFDNSVVAFLSLVLVASQPWFIWLSGTPMLEIYFLAFFIGGIYLLLIWLKQGSGWGWLGAGILFFLATGFHIQSWAQINIINLFTLPLFLQFVAQRQFNLAIRLFLFWVIGNSFIILSGLAEYRTTGELFAILGSHAEYSRWFYGGYDVPLLEKLLYFPRLIAESIPIWLWLFGLIGLALTIYKQNWWGVLLLGLGLFTLTIASFFNLSSGPPSAAPGRYAVFYLLLLAPYAAYGFYQLWRQGWLWGQKRFTPSAAYGWAITFSALVAILILLSVNNARHFPIGIARDTVDVGQYIHQVLLPTEGSDAFSPDLTVMLEARYWDFLALELLIEQRERIVYDREHHYLERDNPSQLLDTEQNVADWLRREQVGLLVLHDAHLKERATELSFLALQNRVGDWSVFRVMGSAE